MMFQKTLRRRKQALSLSETKVACLIGVPDSTLSDIELGKRQPWPKIRRDLSKVLGVPEVELFPDIQVQEDRNGQ